MKLRVLISLEPDSMRRTRGSRQKRRRRSTVKVVNNVVICRPELSRDTRAGHHTAALQFNYVIDMRMIVEQRRDPIFHENIDLGVWQEALQSER